MIIPYLPSTYGRSTNGPASLHSDRPVVQLDTKVVKFAEKPADPAIVRFVESLEAEAEEDPFTNMFTYTIEEAK